MKSYCHVKKWGLSSCHSFKIIIIDGFSHDSWGAIRCLNCFQIIFITKAQYENKELIICPGCGYQETQDFRE